MERFRGQTVFVTGGNKGIGRSNATRFAQEGARVAIAAIEKDTPDAAAVKAAYAAVEAKLGPLSVAFLASDDGA